MRIEFCGRELFNAAAIALAVASAASSAHAGDPPVLPPGFSIELIPCTLNKPTTIAFASDGRFFVAEQRGVVHVFVNGVQQPQPFIDLREEVGGQGYRGMLGMALDPNFTANHHVYFTYIVDQVPGEPDDSHLEATFCRLTRYTGTAASNGNIADPASRHMLLGQTPPEGVILCYSHTIDAIKFAHDGSLFVGIGDGAHQNFADAGGHDRECFQPPLSFPPDQDRRGFVPQYLGSMNGKILRIDPATGHGLPTNPYWDGDPQSIASKVWVSGLRQPYRLAVRPGSQSPGSLYIGDVGEDAYEEIDIAKHVGGENFGWPCREGFTASPEYPDLKPAHSGCDTIMTPANPGVLTDPIAAWHHAVGDWSNPAGYTGLTVVGGTFYAGTSYPLPYRGAYFYGEWREGWVNVVRVDDKDNVVNMFNFSNSFFPWEVVDWGADPITGDLYVVNYFDNDINRLRYDGPGPGDITGDGVVNVDDLLAVINAWGACKGGPQLCPADIDGSGETNVDDLLLVINNWG